MEEKKDIKFSNIISFADTKNNRNDIKNIKLTKEIIKLEKKRKMKSNELPPSNQNANLISDNIFILIIIILIMLSIFFFKKKLISFKRNYLSDKSLFKFNIFYSNSKYCFLLFIILLCIKKLSTGLELLFLQTIVYLLCFITILIKNKLNNLTNNFQKDKIVFHCSDIIISFLFLGKIIKNLDPETFAAKLIIFILIMLNLNIMIYFILVEIINCSYEDIIIYIIYGLIISISVFYFIYYIIKIKIKPKRILSIIISNIINNLIMGFFFLILFFSICSIKNKLEYFYVTKILMKLIGVFLYIIFEIYFLFRTHENEKFQYFYLYNFYSNIYLYSKTSNIKKLARVLISVSIEYFITSKLDISYKNNFGTFKNTIIILMDIFHGFLILYIIKYFYKILNLNNCDLLNIDYNSRFLRFGSFSDGKENNPLLFIEQ